MTQILLGPVLTDAPTVKVKDKGTGQVYFRKQILPEGKYEYKDQDLDLSSDTHKQILESFKAGAFDEVPFQFGPEHNNDTFRRGGTMVNLEYVPGQGTFGLFDFSTSPEAAEYVGKYPNFGVSPRIVLDHKRMDGKSFPAAIQHICGTVVPRATGMSPWEKVELSAEEDIDSDETVDLSGEIIKGVSVATVPVVKNKEKESGTTVELSEDQLNYLKRKMAEDAEIERLFAGVTGQQQESEVQIPKEITLSLSNHEKEIAALKAANVRAEWQARKISLLAAGVPPAVLNLAEPLMTQTESRVIDLSTDEGTVQISDKTQMISVLESLKGTVDLSGEKGHEVGGQEPSEDSYNAEQIDQFLNNFGIK